jgi:hypothetical protein
MFFSRKLKIQKEQKDMEVRLRKLEGREIRYVSERDDETYVERVLGKYGAINIVDDIFAITCEDKVVFSHNIKGLMGSDLMSLDGIILSYFDERINKEVEVIAYYKYYRKLEK